MTITIYITLCCNIACVLKHSRAL